MDAESKGARAEQLIDDEVFQEVVRLLREEQQDAITDSDLAHPETLIEPVAILKALDRIERSFVRLINNADQSSRPKPRLA